MQFEGSLRIRVVHAYPLYDPDKNLIGYEHLAEVHKTKIGEKKQKIPVFSFHTLAGGEAGAGFDRARDVFSLGVDLGVIDKNGAHYSFKGEKLGQGEEKVISILRTLEHEGSKVLDEIERAIREKFSKSEAGIADGEPGEEVSDRSDTKPGRRRKT